MKQYKVIFTSGDVLLVSQIDYNTILSLLKTTNVNPIDSLVLITEADDIVFLKFVECVKEAFKSGVSGILEHHTPEQRTQNKEALKDESVGSLTSVIDKNKPDEVPKV